jgi:hypothetical protein
MFNDVIDQCNGTGSVPPWTSPIDSAIFFSDYVTPGVWNTVSADFGGQAMITEMCANGSGGPVGVEFTAGTAQNGGTWAPGMTEITMQAPSVTPDETGYIELTFTY